MKQVLQDRSGTTVVREVPPPPSAPGSVLVRVAFSVISSGTERARVELSKKSLIGKARERPDLVREVVNRAKTQGIRATRDAVKLKLSEETPVGYSLAGIVLAVGEAVRGLTPGDAVACGGGNAGHAEIASVPANLCAKVPANVPLESAAMTTLGAIALHGVRLADVRLGDRVAVIGCGLVGQIACRLLQASGADVFALDIDPVRVERARAGGAHRGFVVADGVAPAVVAATGGHGVDAVVVTAAAPVNDPLLLAAAVARDRGAVVLVGDVPIQFPRAALYDKELSFRVSRSYGPGRYDAEYEERGLDYPIGFVRWTEQRNMEAVLDLQERGELRLDDLVDEILPVEEAVRAYGLLTGPLETRPRGAIVLAYPDSGVATEAEPRALETLPASAIATRTATTPPVRVALIGPGGFAGRVLVPALARAGARLELVGGGSGPSAAAAARTLGFERIAESEDAAITDPSIDAVVIATRHASHAALSTRALQTGKHVFCEKPLALTTDELDEVVAAAQTSSGILAVGFNRRFSPLLRELRTFVTGPGGLVTASYRVSAGPIPPEHWIHDLAQGGGRALGEVCHFIDSLTFIAGAPVGVVYAVGYGALAGPVQARDNLAVTLSFANGSVGSITYVADGSGRVPKERIEAFSGPLTAVLDDYTKLELFGPDGRQKRDAGTQDKGHSAEIEAFLEGAARGELPVPLDEIANVSLATLAVVESMRTGRPITIIART
jgi:predicted dehydrogenase/threonine dehydrogenase-like Zn-dependent dehydrogenase